MSDPDPTLRPRDGEDVATLPLASVAGASRLGRGSAVGRYVVLQRRGEGGMGVVYSAYDPTLDRKVALKMLLPGEDGSRGRGMLLREAQALARLQHPNVVAVHDVGRHAGGVFIAMEFVVGETLDEWLRREKPARSPMLDVFLAAGRGLASAHRAGLVHRDFKPGNVMVGDDRRVRVMDFGLALYAGAETDEPTGGDSLLITRTGALVGTPAYMAPEQFDGATADARSDQFSFTVALYEALYGRRPFAAKTLEDLSRVVRAGDIAEPPADAEVPGWLRRVLVRGLRTDPAARFRSMDALLLALTRDPSRRRATRIAAVAGVGVLGLVGVGTVRAVQTEDPCGQGAARVAAQWTAPRRETIRAALVATAAPHAADTWSQLEPMLDDYAQRTAAAQRSVCEATHVRHEQSIELLDRKMACLARRWAAWEELLSMLAAADRELVDRAAQSIIGLPDPGKCVNLPNVPGAVSDPAVAAQVSAAQQELSAIEAVMYAGRYDDAVTRAEAALERAEQIGDPALKAEAVFVLAGSQRRAGDPEAARANFERAVRWAAEGNDAGLQARAWIDLIYTEGVPRAATRRALAWQLAAEVAVAEAGQPAELRSAFHNALGEVYRTATDYDRSREHYETALAATIEAYGDDDARVSPRLNNLALVVFEHGDYDRALRLHERAYAIDVRALGARHPVVATDLHNLARIEAHLGDSDSARERYQQALRINVELLGEAHPAVARTLNNLGSLAYSAGEFDEARGYFGRAIEVWTQSLGAGHPQIGKVLNNLANVESADARHAEAVERYREAAEIFAVRYPQGHLGHATTLTGMGNALRQLERYDEAVTVLTEALEEKERLVGPNHRSVGFTVLGLAEVALDRGDLRGAIPLLLRAIAISEADGTAPRILGSARLGLARARYGTTTDPAVRAQAIALAESARQMLRDSPLGDGGVLAEVEAWLAEHRGK